MPPPLANVGGQAVMEGVLMRAPGSLGVAVRRATGEIVVRERVWHDWGSRQPFWRWPLLRGVAAVGEGMQAGFEGMAFAAEQAGMRGPLAPAAIGSARGLPCDRRQAGSEMLLSFVMAALLGVGLFVVVPHGMAVLLGKLWGGLAVQSLGFVALAGFSKLLILIAYLGLLGQVPEVRRLFMYHGAEHKVICAYEAGDPLDVAHARRHGTFHARCGTSFLLMLVVLGMTCFAVVMPWLPITLTGWQGHVGAILIKMLLLAPVAGLAYEVNRWASLRLGRPLVRWLMAPGFWLQRMTVREPTDAMLEVALAALNATLSGERQAVVVDAKRPFSYRHFADACARQG